MKNVLLGLFLVLSYSVTGQKPNTVLPRPKLVVGIVVDQMRWDYLYRYYDRYGQDGFRRMLREGFTCENTFIDYIPTLTAVGHSTVYTGSVPAIHGITGNDFIIEATGKSMYCTEDSTVETVGSSSDAGEMSPRNLLSSTITDELKLATNFRSKVIGISLKDRGSILPAGHTANAAYWFDDLTGNWISSTYYMKKLPEWVIRLNEQKLPEKYMKKDWNTLYDIKTYVQSSLDDNLYEGKFAGSSTSIFPVKTSSMLGKSYEAIRTTPYGNTITFDMAKAAIKNESLGKGHVVDFLALSFSSTDYIGHKVGVNAIETEDTYLRFDRDLADFFSYLDATTGKGNYTVFLTSDHGAAHNPAFLDDNRIPAGYWGSSQLLRDLNVALDDAFHLKNVIISLNNYQVHLNNKLIASSNLDEDVITRAVIRFLRGKPSIAFVVDNTDLAASPIPEELKNRVRNGYNPKRAGRITIILEPGWYSGTDRSTGTTHGSWYAYDAHIPLLWMGWGIKHGSTNKPTRMSDISPTLSALLHIQEPNGSIGQVIGEVLK